MDDGQTVIASSQPNNRTTISQYSRGRARYTITNHKDINTLARIHKHIHVSAKLAQPNIFIHSFTVVVLLLLGPVGVTLSDDDVLYP